MKKSRAKHPRLRVVLLCLLGIFVIAAVVFMRLGGFSTGESADPIEFAAYAGTVEDIEIPDGVSIVALGEATHGNAEFQQLKLDVFRHLVETSDVRAFALEADYGGCEWVNRYIHGGEGTTGEAVVSLGFLLYRTDEMAALIDYMRAYNETAAEGDDLRFYGIDMQRYRESLAFLVEACGQLQVDTGELEALMDGANWSDEYDTAARTEAVERVRTELLELENSADAVHLADMLLQNMSLPSDESGGLLRDKYMAENALWLSARERELGHGRIFVSAHNGHVGKFGYDQMGRLLANELGEGYYVIGTDFYKTRCNLPVGRTMKRANHVFYSHDPLAKAAKLAGLQICWLDFDKAAQSPALAEYVSDYHYMGSLGEIFVWYMRVLPPSYRIFQTPDELYDGMIFVADASPTRIWTDIK